MQAIQYFDKTFIGMRRIAVEATDKSERREMRIDAICVVGEKSGRRFVVKTLESILKRQLELPDPSSRRGSSDKE